VIRETRVRNIKSGKRLNRCTQIGEEPELNRPPKVLNRVRISRVVIADNAKHDFFENALWVLSNGEPRVSILERKTTSAMEVVKLICSGNEGVREGFYWSA
jgi:hypothetical protein